MITNDVNNNLVALESLEAIEDELNYQHYAQRTKNKLSEMRSKALSLLNKETQQGVESYVTPIQDKGYKGVFNFVELDYPNGNEVPNVKVIQVEIKEFYLS